MKQMPVKRTAVIFALRNIRTLPPKIPKLSFKNYEWKERQADGETRAWNSGTRFPKSNHEWHWAKVLDDPMMGFAVETNSLS